MYATHEDRRDTIVTHAWETWTKNGLGLDDEMQMETVRTVRYVVNHTYVVGITDSDWLAAAIKRLG